MVLNSVTHSDLADEAPASNPTLICLRFPHGQMPQTKSLKIVITSIHEIHVLIFHGILKGFGNPKQINKLDVCSDCP
jgi:hypothetical protein